MKSVFEKARSQIEDKKIFILAALVILCALAVYLIRGGGHEFSLFLETLSILVVFFCAILVPVIGIAVFLAGLLIYKVIRYAFDKNGSFIPLFLLIGSMVLALKLPLPPLREEASFIKYQADYEQIVTLAKSNQLEHGNDCLADSPSS